MNSRGSISAAVTWRRTRKRVLRLGALIAWYVLLAAVALYFGLIDFYSLLVVAVVTAVVSAGFLEWVASRGKFGRWLTTASRQPRYHEPPPVAESFEIDLPCGRCGSPNVGTEAGEWHEGAYPRVFRSCDSCGTTEWWSMNENPPRVRRRERPVKIREARAMCDNCGYDLTRCPLRRESRGGNREIRVQQCPECGRAEVVLPRK